ncbi:hypothetical protein BC826DRAFT_1110007 [Russula brevipes]|nr:hypothetical protein BC826DRAFT_1110007 [Russula brevipes]
MAGDRWEGLVPQTPSRAVAMQQHQQQLAQQKEQSTMAGDRREGLVLQTPSRAAAMQQHQQQLAWQKERREQVLANKVRCLFPLCVFPYANFSYSSHAVADVFRVARHWSSPDDKPLYRYDWSFSSFIASPVSTSSCTLHVVVAAPRTAATPVATISSSTPLRPNQQPEAAPKRKLSVHSAHDVHLELPGWEQPRHNLTDYLRKEHVARSERCHEVHEQVDQLQAHRSQRAQRARGPRAGLSTLPAPRGPQADLTKRERIARTAGTMRMRSSQHDTISPTMRAIRAENRLTDQEDEILPDQPRQPKDDPRVPLEQAPRIAAADSRQTVASRLAEQAIKLKPEVTLPPQYQQFAKVFSEKALERFPPSRPYDHAIDLKPDAPATLPTKAIRLPADKLLATKEFLDE